MGLVAALILIISWIEYCINAHEYEKIAKKQEEFEKTTLGQSVKAERLRKQHEQDLKDGIFY
jgi:hypothetical protein